MTTSNNPDEIRAEIERTRYELGQDVDALAEKVSPTKAVSRQTDRVRDGFINVKESIMGTPDHRQGPGVTDRVQGAAQDAADQARGYAHQAGEQVSEWADDAQHAVQQAPAQIRRQTRGNPLAAGVIALGAGWLLSSLLPSSRLEQDAAQRVKHQAAPLVETAKREAKNVAQEVREEIQPELQQAADAVKDSATDAAQHVKADGQDKAQGIKQESQQAAQQVKGTAQNA